MRANRSLLSVAVILTLAIAGCGGGATADSEGTSGGEVDYSGPIASTDEAEGENQFEMYCSGCHPGGQGSRSGPAIAGERMNPGAARRQIREGGSHMPDFGPDEIADEDLEALLAYLVTMDVVEAPAELDVEAPAELDVQAPAEPAVTE